MWDPPNYMKDWGTCVGYGKLDPIDCMKDEDTYVEYEKLDP